MARSRPDVRFVTRKWPPAIGGMETYCVRLTEELAKRTSMEVLALPGQKSGQVPSAIALIVFGIRTVAKLLTAEEARVVHIGDVACWPLAWAASVRHPNSRILISGHGSDLSSTQRPGLRGTLYRAYVRLGARLLGNARLIANSRYVAGLAREAGFRRTDIVPLGTDLVAQEAERGFNLLYVGRISRPKGLRFIVEEVLPLLPSQNRLRVAGTIWEESERELLGDPRVDYLGPLAPEDLASEYACAAAVLIPTRNSEGFGLVAIEAAACGAFVIASRHSGLADVVKPPVGVTVNADDADEWAAAIKAALDMPDGERKTQGRAARDLVDRDYRWARVADATLSLYEAD